jgi:serine/threonine protein kinase
MELAEYGNLNNFLLQRNKPIEWTIRMKWSMQLTNSLLYLHQIGIIHSKNINDI